jgi:dihydroneopterin aldolase/2-amino-4-hydroxy-6-hydroxymethyldihydropteridine diphosphokinase
MTRAYVGMGSNIDPEQNVRQALLLLREQVRIIGISTIYRTLPTERPDQPMYLNAVVAIETTLLPRDLKFLVLRQIEAKLGRVRTDDRFASRPIDLDLIVYDNLAVQERDLVLPDPEIAMRPFLALPLAELAPDLVLPGSSLAVRDAAAALTDREMTPAEDLTTSLRKEMLDEREP